MPHKMSTWTFPESQVLINGRTAVPPESYFELANQLGNRTPVECRAQCYVLLGRDHHSHERVDTWGSNEDVSLLPWVVSRATPQPEILRELVPGRSTASCYNRIFELREILTVHEEATGYQRRGGQANADVEQRYDMINNLQFLQYSMASGKPVVMSYQTGIPDATTMYHSGTPEYRMLAPVAPAPWSTTERSIMLSAHAVAGPSSWEEVAAMLPGRCAAECWREYMRYYGL